MYEAPVKDLNFVIKNLINLEELNKISDYQDFLMIWLMLFWKKQEK
jgi:hypothetical protein